MPEPRKRNQKLTKPVAFDTVSTPRVFSDVTQVNVSGEHALLMFGQKDPLDESRATGVCSVYLTIPHLVRLRELLDHVLADMVERGLLTKGKDA